MLYEEELEDEGSIMKNMKFMTSKGGALLVVENTMISTKDLLLNKSLVKRKLGYIPFIRISWSSLVKRE